MHTAYCTLHTACTMHTAYCTLTLHTEYCTLHSTHCTLHTAHYNLHTTNCKSHNVASPVHTALWVWDPASRGAGRKVWSPFRPWLVSPTDSHSLHGNELWRIVSHSTVLHCTVSTVTVLQYRIVLHCILNWTVLYCTALCPQLCVCAIYCIP